MTVVYEISIFKYIVSKLFPVLLPVFIGAVIFAFACFFVYKYLKKNPDSDFLDSVKKQVRHPKFFGGILIALITLQFIVLGFYYVDSSISDVELIKDYQNGKCHVVSGAVEQYSPYMGDPNQVFYPYYGKHETFYVDGVFFALIDGVSLGYDTPAINGGLVTGNGQKVEIYYLTDGNGNNHIMKLKTDQ